MQNGDGGPMYGGALLVEWGSSSGTAVDARNVEFKSNAAYYGSVVSASGSGSATLRFDGCRFIDGTGTMGKQWPAAVYGDVDFVFISCSFSNNAGILDITSTGSVTCSSTAPTNVFSCSHDPLYCYKYASGVTNTGCPPQAT